VNQDVADLVERERIRRVMHLYARGVDRREWSLVADAYHADGFDDHGGYKGDIPGLIAWLKRRHETIEQSMHFLGNCTVEFVSDGIAIAETYCVVYQRYGEDARETIDLWIGKQALPSGAKLMAELVCRYVDRFERRDGHWRIARRTVVMEEVKASIEPVRLQQGHAIATRDRSDALWKALREP
jgi:hypothetical protein